MGDTESFFSSRRERRLWLLALVAVAAVYATLGLSSILPGVLYDQGVAAVAFVACMLAIGIAVLTQGLEVRPRGREIGLGLGIAAVYGFLFVRMAIPERSHLIEYSVVAFLVYEALAERAAQGRRVPVPALLAIVATAAIGALDEGIQAVLPHRVFDPLDMLFNALAAVMAVVAVAVLRRVRRGRGRGASGKADGATS